MPSYTIVERVSDQLGYHCGYCSKDDTAKAKGMWAHSMNAIDYQDLIDRGWRRSGKYCYKPIMNETCCPQYTIRCKALEYKPTKSKKKVLKKMRQYLMTEGNDEVMKWREKNSYEKSDNKEGASGNQGFSVDRLAPGDAQPTQIKKEVKKGTGPDPSKPLCKKAKVLRQEKRKKGATEPHSGDASTSSNQKNQQQSVEDQIPHLTPSINFKRKLEIRTIWANVHNPEFQSTKQESYTVYKKYQTTIHKDAPTDCTEKQWTRFLVDCPINRDEEGPGPGFGNYHQQYILDGKIIAVGVIDILPNSLSSVYLYYDPDYGFLSLGAYTAISEIAFTRKLQKEFDQLLYYYMGFYIHSCPKMNYKQGFPPSQLLCPETYDWVPVELCLPSLDKSKYSRLNVIEAGSPVVADSDREENFDISKLGVLFKRTLMDYYQYVRFKYAAVEFPGQNTSSDAIGSANVRSSTEQKEMEEELEELQEYVSIVGTKCAERMFLYRSY